MIRTLFVFLFVTGLAFGQDSTLRKNREFYFTLADFSPLSVEFKYKHQIGERTYLKFGLVNLSGSRISYIPNQPFNFKKTDWNYAAGIEMGIEFRKPLANKISFFHGPNLRYSYQNNTRHIPNSITLPVTIEKIVEESHTISIPYSVGILFILRPKLLLAIEMNPAINFTHTRSRNGSNTYNSNVFGANLDNRYGLLSLGLRF